MWARLRRAAVTRPGRGGSCSRVGPLGPRSTRTHCTQRMLAWGTLPRAPPGASSFCPMHLPSGCLTLTLLGRNNGPALVPSSPPRLGPCWAFPDRQDARVDRSLSGSSRPRGLCSLETFPKTGRAAPGHGPQWVLCVRGRRPRPHRPPGGLADAQEGLWTHQVPLSWCPAPALAW